ncbi:hypothetical protein ALHIDCOG_00429 [Klebsiella phage CPRSB]|nr:hypothetical protein ALHIDCOG_00429 [Klebsiella phage CPRSB]
MMVNGSLYQQAVAQWKRKVQDAERGSLIVMKRWQAILKTGNAKSTRKLSNAI